MSTPADHMERSVRWMPSLSALVLTTAGSIVLALGLAALGSPILHFVIVAPLIAAGFLGVFVAPMVAGPLSTSVSPDRRRTVERIVKATPLVILFLGVQITGLFLEFYIDSACTKEARHWCESLGPELEAWRSRTGAYPKELSSLGRDLDPPRYCRDALKYEALPGSYRLTFTDADPLSGWTYSSETRTWTHFD